MYSIFTPSHRGGSGAPMVCLHGFTDTWRTWELVLPALEARHDVLADAVEQAMDGAGMPRAHVVGNSLGGYLALQLAARGRAESVVALAPAGGWAPGDDSFRETLAYFTRTQQQLRQAAPNAEAIVASRAARRLLTAEIAVNFEHIPPELLAHQIRGAADCSAASELIGYALREGWKLDAEHIDCPVRIVWGAADRLLPWPSAATRFREDWLPHADWVELENVGHCPQMDIPLETAELILGFTTV